MISELQKQTGTNALQVSSLAGIGYHRLLRWRKRASTGEPVLASPGPKKVGPLPLHEIKAMVADLRHRRRRTFGTVALYQHARHGISRRELARLVAQERGAQYRARRQVFKRVVWHRPNLAWTMDATELGKDSGGQRLYAHQTQDLASRYGFKSMLSLASKGKPLAAHLRRLIEAYGAPLFMKRDNGSPFNCQEVDDVLAEHLVIPLNSPAYYPQYNGAVEKGIREVKVALGEVLAPPKRWRPQAVAPYVNAVRVERNSRPRRSLKGRSAAEVYHQQPHATFSKAKRRAIFVWIQAHAKDRLEKMEKIDHRSVSAAWRAAAETWLVCQGLITISETKKVLPYLTKKNVRE
jgi:transposase InsO family protein